MAVELIGESTKAPMETWRADIVSRCAYHLTRKLFYAVFLPDALLVWRVSFCEALQDEAEGTYLEFEQA